MSIEPKEPKETGRVSQSCLKESEKSIGMWVVIFPFAFTLLMLIGFIYNLSLIAWDFMSLSWYGWTEFGFLVAGVLAFLLALVMFMRAKKCPQ